MAMDSKNNETVGGPALQRVSYRFRASATSDLVSVAVIQRGGPRYSGRRRRVDADQRRERHAAATRPGRRWPACRSRPAIRRRPGNGRTASRSRSLPGVIAGDAIPHRLDQRRSGPDGRLHLDQRGLPFAPTVPRQPRPGLQRRRRRAGRRRQGLDCQPERHPDHGPDVRRRQPRRQRLHLDHRRPVRAHLGPDDMVRERFTVSGGSREVTSAAVRVKRIDGTSPLVVRLTDAATAPSSPRAVPATGRSVERACRRSTRPTRTGSSSRRSAVASG